MKKKIAFIWLIFVLFTLGYLKVTQKPVLKVTMCNVGQGDAYLISYKMFEILIDGGPNRRILECLASAMPHFDKTIEVVIATHPDKDHVAGLEYVLTAYKVDQIITNGAEKDTAAFLGFKNAMKASTGIKTVARQGQTFSYEGVHAKILWPEEDYAKTVVLENGKIHDISNKSALAGAKNSDDANAGSIVLRLEFGDFSALFTGDLEIPQEQILLSSGEIRPVTLLKIGHHGSKYSTSPEFLQASSPQLAFIGVGKGNVYGHPTKRVTDLLEENHIKIYRSDQDGQVTLESDGKSIWKM
ncbi:MAG TPA: ComEC/Rec2 family competence protein [Candidatus Saccharimonadia bacterium]|nr:ComEC/Rec2 family competence protein [Candidatus Saccharimonadia bacterium]